MLHKCLLRFILKGESLVTLLVSWVFIVSTLLEHSSKGMSGVLLFLPKPRFSDMTHSKGNKTEAWGRRL